MEIPNTNDNIDDYYQITTEQLGRGYFSKVVVGIDKKTNEHVAIKLIDKTKVEETPNLLKNEIDIMSRLQHPNIVGMKAVFDTDSTLFIVMELVKEGELYDMIASRKQFSEKDAACIMKQIFSALKYLHENGIVHRDLKLENLLIVNRKSLEIKLADFGLSKFYSGQSLLTACGTSYYVAPDVLLGTGYGPAVDLWACGVILYVLLSGRLPFYADNEPELFKLIMEGIFIFKSPQFDTVSKEAKDLISHLLEIDPEKRYTAEKALLHPFIRNNNKKPLHPSLIKDLRKLSKLSRYKLK